MRRRAGIMAGSRIDLEFDHTVVGGRKQSRFVRGVIHRRPQVGPDYAVVNCSRKHLSGLYSGRPFVFAASDFAP
jgi:hypothetical protein